MKLTPKTAKLLNKLVEWNFDEEIRMAMGGTTIPLTAQECYNYYDAKYSGKDFLVGVEDSNGHVRGCFFFENSDMRHQRIYMHFTFDKKFWQVRKACARMGDFLFGEMHIRQVHGIVSEDNHPARSFVKRMGWRTCGILPDYFSTPDGFKNAYHYVLEQDYRRF